MKDIRHGVNCKKAAHTGDGYLHAADDDTPYDVDGVLYCGRCHKWISTGEWLPDDDEAMERPATQEPPYDQVRALREAVTRECDGFPIRDDEATRVLASLTEGVKAHAPTAWLWIEDPWGANQHHVEFDDPKDSKWIPLYEAPATRGPLTNAEIIARLRALGLPDWTSLETAYTAGVRFAERMHGITGAKP